MGFFEEFLFRGYTQFTLASGVGFWPAATMLSAAFGALHLGNGGEDKVGALSVFVIGMFFCLTLRRTGNLWFAVGLHAAFDWGETFLFSVPDSGIVAPGHLLNSSFHGPVWLTGGTVGPEGSVMAFVVVGASGGDFQPGCSRRRGKSAIESTHRSNWQHSVIQSLCSARNLSVVLSARQRPEGFLGPKTGPRNDSAVDLID